jgi:hypothetical protein
MPVCALIVPTKRESGNRVRDRTRPLRKGRAIKRGETLQRRGKLPLVVTISDWTECLPATARPMLRQTADAFRWTIRDSNKLRAQA